MGQAASDIDAFRFGCCVARGRGDDEVVPVTSMKQFRPSFQTGTPCSSPKRWHALDVTQQDRLKICEEIHELFDLEQKPLGEGGFGSVVKARERHTGASFAVKWIRKKKQDQQKVSRQIALMRRMDHPNIIKLHETYEDYCMTYMVMELCSGGELFDRIIQEERFNERHAAILMQQIFRATQYMHGESICHRDIKPENFLLLTPHPIERSVLKLIDFGLACEFTPGKLMKTVVGSSFYIAPQVIRGEYDHLSDLWSCGVLMFIFLCGYPPFTGPSDIEVLRQVRRGQFEFKREHWSHISEDARNLVSRLLSVTPGDRPTAEEALHNVWIRGLAPRARTLSSSLETTGCLLRQLRAFRSQTIMRKKVLQATARFLDEKELRSLRTAFAALDADGDGLISSDELKEGLKRNDLKDLPPDLEHMINEVSMNAQGGIDFSVFLDAAIEKKHALQENVCWASFRTFDRNGDGRISVDELRQVLMDPDVMQALGTDEVTQREVLDYVMHLDANDDGGIDYYEFLEMMRTPSFSGGGGTVKGGRGCCDVTD